MVSNRIEPAHHVFHNKRAQCAGYVIQLPSENQLFGYRSPLEKKQHINMRHPVVVLLQKHEGLPQL